MCVITGYGTANNVILFLQQYKNNIFILVLRS